MIKVLRGRIVTPDHGVLDFSRDDIPVEICQQLFESDFPYLELTDKGKSFLYGIIPEAGTQILPQSKSTRRRKKG